MNCQECDGMLIETDNTKVCSNCGLTYDCECPHFENGEDTLYIEQCHLLKVPKISNHAKMNPRLVRRQNLYGRTAEEIWKFKLKTPITNLLSHFDLGDDIVNDVDYMFKKIEKQHPQISNRVSLYFTIFYLYIKKNNYPIQTGEYINFIASFGIRFTFSIIFTNIKTYNLNIIGDTTCYNTLIQNFTTRYISELKNSPDFLSILQKHMKKYNPLAIFDPIAYFNKISAISKKIISGIQRHQLSRKPFLVAVAIIELAMLIISHKDPSVSLMNFDNVANIFGIDQNRIKNQLQFLKCLFSIGKNRKKARSESERPLILLECQRSSIFNLGHKPLFGGFQ